MNVIHLLYASTSAYICCMFKNVSVFPRVNVYAKERQTSASLTLGTSRALVVFPLTEVRPSHT